MLKEIHVLPVERAEEARYQQLMQAHHYLGALPTITETVWYVASWSEHWVALLQFSAAAWQCAARERFGCRLDQGRRLMNSEYVIRDSLIRVDPLALGRPRISSISPRANMAESKRAKSGRPPP